MVKSAVVFAGRNGLDFFELRSSVLRIPEVSIRIKEAQDIFDKMDIPSFDFRSYIASDDETFLRNLKLKSLAAAVVQVALWDRHCKYNRKPEFMVGNSNGDSAMAVCAGKISFAEMVEKSQAILTLKPFEKPTLVRIGEAAPILAGHLLTEYEVFRGVADEAGKMTFAADKAGAIDLKKILASLTEEEGVTQFVSIGPANAVLTAEVRSTLMADIDQLDSIEMDPMLSWFWKNVRSQQGEAAIAQ